MCWNAEVSLNTFLFSSFVLCLIIYNNTYTQYKIKDFNNIWIYLFFVSFILMQLFEFFIWRNVDNKLYNKLFTILATLLLLVQPIASNMLITNKSVQQSMLFVYMICMVPFAIYRFMTQKINSTISDLGHLQWNMLLDNKSKIDNVIITIWFIFFLFPLFYQKKTFGFLFGAITLLIMIYNYYKDNTVGSMWCWVVNSIMVYYAIYLLLYLPFFK
jgi:hypothetical protein